MRGHTGAVVAAVAVLALALCAACDDRPDGAQLDAWRREAQRQNAVRLTEAMAERPLIGPGWTLSIGGQVRAPETLRWKEIDALAQAWISTTSPQNPADPTARVRFRGIPVSELIDRAGPDPAVTEVTFVAHDAFRATIDLADARRWPILLAIAADGQPIPRAAGGPIFLVFPHSDFPETRARYPDRYWCFYVTDVVFGTEPIAVRLGEKTADAAELAALPQHTIETKVHYKVHWPPAAVALHGVRVADLLASRKLLDAPPAGAMLEIKGKAPIQRDPADPLRIPLADVAGCELLLVTAWGPDRAPIPARLGGPVTLAIPPACQDRYGDNYWVTFVESLALVTP